MPSLSHMSFEHVQSFRTVHSQVRQFYTFSPYTIYRRPRYHKPCYTNYFSCRWALASFVPTLLNNFQFRFIFPNFTELHTIRITSFIACRSLSELVSRRYSIIPNFNLIVLLFELLNYFSYRRALALLYQ